MNELPWEDALLERKVESDLKDLLKTLVAFANSVRPEHTATILIGEKNDGTVQGVTNPDQIQKKVRSDCDEIYPSIVWRSQVYERDGKHCVRVEIEYSVETPHFGGIAWVRRGSETVKAADEVFQRLIEFRLSKVRELAMWLDKEVTVKGETGVPPVGSYFSGSTSNPYHPRWHEQADAKLNFVNSFWATFEVESKNHSEPLEKLTLSWDDSKNRLLLLVKL
ncbi:MAG: hypothetical protein A3G20_06750 [Acidobacteria bacterium RIFCSPLOWO2_12_FULL_59_11]|nr:MAG: hypothetical protein A3G20_06750 [Acidobacteria bacterium RIFCSPLOWO2_12_FULL_59_11]